MGNNLLKSPTCGPGITNNVDLSTAADDTFDVDTNWPNTNDTESTMAPKDVMVLLAHGLCVVNGATSAKMKLGKGPEKM